MLTTNTRYKLKTSFNAQDTIHTDLTAGDTEIQTRWRRKRDIGIGGYGLVWLEEEEGGQLRAVKRLPQAVKNVDWSRELDILAQLREHKNLFVEFLGWYEDEDKGFVYFAMEYIEGGDLSQYLKIFGLKVRLQAKDIVSQILEGLVILHKQNICHRDIKPKNILIASTSPIRVKIADFGLSKNQDNTSLRTDCGTLGYLAPELQGFVRKFKRGSYTNFVDIWSMGILTHEILTLEIPFLLVDTDAFDSDSGLEPGSGLGSKEGRGPEPPVIDMNLFSDYCRGRESFPTESLRKSGVSNDGIDFVVALLNADPHFRISAATALKSRWLLVRGPETLCLKEKRAMGPEREREQVIERARAREIERVRAVERGRLELERLEPECMLEDQLDVCEFWSGGAIVRVKQGRGWSGWVGGAGWG